MFGVPTSRVPKLDTVGHAASHRLIENRPGTQLFSTLNRRQGRLCSAVEVAHSQGDAERRKVQQEFEDWDFNPMA